MSLVAGLTISEGYKLALLYGKSTHLKVSIANNWHLLLVAFFYFSQSNREL